MFKGFRTLKAEEIEVRVQSTKNGKANMLLYIDSRAVTQMLDEAVGPMNWTTEFYECNGQMMGKLGIWDEEKKQWVYKSDTGSESNIEAEKGLVSDVYKRMLSRWGCVELYSSPKILLDDDGYGNSGYKVSEIDYDDNRKITHLVLVNRFGKEVYRWDRDNAPQTPKMAPQRVIATPQTTDPLEFVVTTPMDTLKAYYETTKGNVEGKELEELVKWKNYYKGKLEKGEWKGDFQAEVLWTRWRNKNVAA